MKRTSKLYEARKDAWGIGDPTTSAKALHVSIHTASTSSGRDRQTHRTCRTLSSRSLAVRFSADSEVTPAPASADDLSCPLDSLWRSTAGSVKEAISAVDDLACPPLALPGVPSSSFVVRGGESNPG
jgi:hypothetical protein